MLGSRSSRREISADMQAPWFLNPPRGVLVPDRRNLTFSTGIDDGADVTAAQLQVGADAVGVTAKYFRNFANRGLGYLDMNAVGTGSITIPTWASAVSGVAKPFTLIFTGQNPPGGAPVANAVLFSFTSSTLTPPRILIVYGAVGTTALLVQRENDASNIYSGSRSFDPGLAPFCFYWAYDGVSSFMSLNGGPVTTDVANGGQLTTDQFAIGMFAKTATLRSKPLMRTVFFDNKAITGAYAQSVIQYLCRRAGI